jgi:DNA-binding response OmpR family regulator
MFELSSNEQVDRSQPSYDILLIEDDEDTGEMLTEFIESESSFRVRTLPSGEAMLQHLQEQSEAMPSVFIIDYLLPGINGLQLLDHLNSLKAFQQVPTILITAATINEDMRTVLQDRNVALITKPLDLTELMDYLEHIRNNSFQQLI